MILLKRGGKIISTPKNTRHRINARINVVELRLIGEKGEQIGIVTLERAMQIAESVSLDLVEIQPNANPPVARLMDYGKQLFKQNKQDNVSKKKQSKIKLKEIKFRPGTEKNDYEVKLRSLRNFLNDGNKVKITVWFRGREMAHQELGGRLIERVRSDLEDIGYVEFFPKLEGRFLIMIVAPNKNKIKQ